MMLENLKITFSKIDKNTKSTNNTLILYWQYGMKILYVDFVFINNLQKIILKFNSIIDYDS